MIKNFQILAGGVKDLEDGWIIQQIKQRCQINSGGEGVNSAGIIRPGDLNETKNGPIGLLPHKFRIDGDERGSR